MNRSLSVVGIVFGAAIQLGGCEPTGVIEDLGTLGGDSSGGLGINKVGNVVGYSYLSGNDPHSTGMHAFRYVDGLGMIDAGALPGGNISEASAINNHGLLVGGSFVAGFVPHAFLANATLTLTDLGTLGGEFSYAWDINDSAEVTGEASTVQGRRHAFVWTSAGGMKDIGTLGGTDSVGRAINESGQVAGESETRNDSTVHAFRYTPKTGMIDLGTLGGAKSSAYGINDSGQVVGESDTGLIVAPFSFRGVSFFGTHAFRWTQGVGMVDLGHLGGGFSTALAINNNGVVVGYSSMMNGAYHAFRWTQEGGMVDLNSLLPRGSGWVLTTAWDINDRGQITGEGLHNGRNRAYRFNPQTQPPIKP